MKIYVYETDDDAINAVVMDGDEVINVVSGFENENMSRSEFVAAARSGFEGAATYDPCNFSGMDMRQAEAHRIMEIYRRKDNVPVRVTTSMHELIDRASTQNFVPVVDDKDAFIGIVTRRSIIQYCKQTLFPED